MWFSIVPSIVPAGAPQELLKLSVQSHMEGAILCVNGKKRKSREWKASGFCLYSDPDHVGYRLRKGTRDVEGRDLFSFCGEFWNIVFDKASQEIISDFYGMPLESIPVAN